MDEVVEAPGVQLGKREARVSRTMRNPKFLLVLAPAISLVACGSVAQGGPGDAGPDDHHHVQAAPDASRMESAVPSHDASIADASDAAEPNVVSGSLASDSSTVMRSFVPSFVGYQTGEGTCSCGQGPYKMLVVALSDDPTILTNCDQPMHLDETRYHYVLVWAFTVIGSTSGTAPPVGEGSYAIEPPGSWQYGPSKLGYVGVLANADEVQGCASYQTCTDIVEIATSGSVSLDAVGDTVSGTFDSSTFEWGGYGLTGPLSGRFVASASHCQSFPLPILLDPCMRCSSGTGG